MSFQDDSAGVRANKSLYVVSVDRNRGVPHVVLKANTSNVAHFSVKHLLLSEIKTNVSFHMFTCKHRLFKSQMNSNHFIYGGNFNLVPPTPLPNGDDWVEKIRKYRECTERCFQKNKWNSKSEMYQCLRQCYRDPDKKQVPDPKSQT